MTPRTRCYRMLVAAALSAAMGAGLAGCGADSPDVALKKGREAAAKGDLATAEIHFKNVLQQRGDDVQARIGLAELHARAFDWPTVGKEARKALDTDPGAIRAAELLLESMAYTADPNKLLATAAALKGDGPAWQALAQAWRGVALWRMGRNDDARRAFDDALGADPNQVMAKIGLLGLKASSEGAAAALGEVQALAAAHPDSSEALWLLARLQEGVRDPAAAAKTLEALLSRWPAHLIARNRLATLALGQGRLDDAEREIGKVLARVPEWPDALVVRAEIALRKGQLDAARDAYLKAAKSDADNPSVLRVGAAVALALREIESAESRALKLQSIVGKRDPEAARLVAAARLLKNDAAGALEVLKPFTELTEAPATLVALAGEAQLRLGRNDLGSALLARAAKSEPGNASILTALAQAQSANRDVAGARASLERAAELDPGSGAERMLVELLLRSQDVAGAQAVADRVAQRAGGAAAAELIRARIALDGRKPDEVRAALERALKADPKSFEAAAALAGLDAAGRNFDGAKARLDQYLKDRPGDQRALLALADLAIRSGAGMDEAKAQLKRALDADADNERVVIAASDLDKALRRPADAVARLSAAVQRRPDSVPLLASLASAQIANQEREQAKGTLDKLSELVASDPRSLFQIAQLRLQSGDAQGALTAFRNLANRWPAVAPQARAGEVAALTRLGREADARTAGADLRKRVADPASGFTLEGDALAAGGNWKGALAAYRQADQIKLGQPSVTVRLHQALQKTGAEDEAQTLLERRTQDPKAPADLLKYAGEVAVVKKDFDAAARYFDRAVRLDPRDAVSLNNLAWSRLEMKDPAEGRRLAEQAFALAPARPEIADTYATALLRADQADKALPLFQQAAAQKPGDAGIRLRNIEALVRTGDKASAQREIDRLARDFPSAPEAAAARKLLAKP